MAAAAVWLGSADWLRRRIAAADPPPCKTVEAIAEYARHPRGAMERLPLTDVLDLDEFPPLLRDVLSGRVEGPAARIGRVRCPRCR